MEVEAAVLEIFQKFDNSFEEFKTKKTGLIQTYFNKRKIAKVEYFSEQIQTIVIEGFSVRAKPSAKGVSIVKYQNKQYYIGDMSDGVKQGEGYFFFGDNLVFKGMFKQDQMFSGFIMHAMTKNWLFEGQFKNNVFEGEGKLTMAQGRVYKGTFKIGKMDGFGVLTEQNGGKYEGHFVNNQKQGQGKMTFANGDIYEGEFVADKISGKGKYTWATGDVYEGEFQESMQHGHGKLLYRIGVQAQGIWEKGSVSQVDYKTVSV